jgi:hypothetical protein
MGRNKSVPAPERKDGIYSPTGEEIVDDFLDEDGEQVFVDACGERWSEHDLQLYQDSVVMS